MKGSGRATITIGTTDTEKRITTVQQSKTEKYQGH